MPQPHACTDAVSPSECRCLPCSWLSWVRGWGSRKAGRGLPEGGRGGWPLPSRNSRPTSANGAGSLEREGFPESPGPMEKLKPRERGCSCGAEAWASGKRLLRLRPLPSAETRGPALRSSRAVRCMGPHPTAMLLGSSPSGQSPPWRKGRRHLL